jgi:chemotaxis response regulator CheB
MKKERTRWPREAIRLGAVDAVVPIQQIPRAILRFLQRPEKKPAVEEAYS